MRHLEYTDTEGRRWRVSVLATRYELEPKLRLRCTSHPAVRDTVLTGAQLGAALQGYAFAQGMLDVEAAKAAGAGQGKVGG